MSLTTEYKGYEIAYAEYREIFVCEELNFSDGKLSGLKSKIDAFDRDNRRLNREVLVIGWHNIRQGVATLLADNDYVWVTVNGKRGKELIKSLADPSHSEKLAQWHELSRQAKEMAARAEAFMETIPRLTKGDLVTPVAETAS